MRFAEGDQNLEKAKDVTVLLQQIPVEPRGLVVLVPWVAVTVLRVHEFVAGAEHWSPVRHHQEREEIFDLLLPQFYDFWRHVLIAFPPAVPTRVVAGSIAVVLAVGKVVLVVVRDQIVKAEPVMRSNVVD